MRNDIQLVEGRNVAGTVTIPNACRNGCLASVRGAGYGRTWESTPRKASMSSIEYYLKCHSNSVSPVQAYVGNEYEK